MNQEQARQLAQRIEDWVIKLGGEVLPTGHFFTWRVMTYLGPLGNYISLFWGDGDAQIIRDTTWAERAYVIDCLARLQQGVMV